MRTYLGGGFSVALRCVAFGVTLAVGGAAFAQKAELPAKFRETKTIRVAVQTDFPPINFKDVATNQLTGIATEIVKALGPKLGVKIELVEATFPQLLPGLETGRFDFLGAGVGDLPMRRDKLTFVDYMKTGPQVFARKSAAATIKELTDLCGKSMGYPRFITSFPAVLKAYSEAECTPKGKAAIQLMTTDLPVQIGLAQNRYDATMQTIEVVAYLSQQEPDTYYKIGPPLHEWLYGLGFLKADEALRDYIATGLDGLIADGTYGRILAKYQVTELAVKSATIDQGKF